MQDFELDRTIEIEGVKIGEGQPAFVIAEIGVNHNGNLNLAKEMIDAAVEAGATCVKFQSFRTEEFMGGDVTYEYTNNGAQVKESMFEMFKRLELPMEWHKELFEYARQRGVAPMTSVADKIIASHVLALPTNGLKLASEDLINIDLVDFVAQAGVPLILSTGMASSEEIVDAFEILKKHGLKKAAFLHCVSVYPTPHNEANLRRMLTLKNFIRGGVVGYSDHTEGIAASVCAVAMGAKIIEKHFTIDKYLEGPDHALSADAAEFKEMVLRIREAESLLGSPDLTPSKTEATTSRLQFRRSIVADRDMKAGEIIASTDIAYRRPGHGLRPRERGFVLGRKLKKSVAKNEMILGQDVV